MWWLIAAAGGAAIIAGGLWIVRMMRFARSVQADLEQVPPLVQSISDSLARAVAAAIGGVLTEDQLARIQARSEVDPTVDLVRVMTTARIGGRGEPMRYHLAVCVGASTEAALAVDATIESGALVVDGATIWEPGGWSDAGREHVLAPATLAVLEHLEAAL